MSSQFYNKKGHFVCLNIGKLGRGFQIWASFVSRSGQDRTGGHGLSRRYILYFYVFYEFNFFDIVNINIKRTITLNFIDIKKNIQIII